MHATRVRVEGRAYPAASQAIRAVRVIATRLAYLAVTAIRPGYLARAMHAIRIRVLRFRVALIMRVIRAAHHAAAAVSLGQPPLTMVVVRVHRKARVALIMRVIRAAYHTAAAISPCQAPVAMHAIRVRVRAMDRVRVKLMPRLRGTHAEHPLQRGGSRAPVKLTLCMQSMKPHHLKHLISSHLSMRMHTMSYEARMLKMLI